MSRSRSPLALASPIYSGGGASTTCRVRLASLVLALTSGCASVPTTGARANGQPLGFDYGSSVHGYMTSEKVGEVRYQNADGQGGTAEIRRDKQVVYRTLEWTPKQGDQQLSDEDFFRIAGDRSAAEEIHSEVSKAYLTNRIGLAVLAIGLGLLAASFPLRDYRVGTSGLVFTAAGGITAGVGAQGLSPSKHVYPLSQAQDWARKYNQQLGAHDGQ